MGCILSKEKPHDKALDKVDIAQAFNFLGGGELQYDLEIHGPPVNTGNSDHSRASADRNHDNGQHQDFPGHCNLPAARADAAGGHKTAPPLRFVSTLRQVKVISGDKRPHQGIIPSVEIHEPRSSTSPPARQTTRRRAEHQSFTRTQPHGYHAYRPLNPAPSLSTMIHGYSGETVEDCPVSPVSPATSSLHSVSVLDEREERHFA